MWCIRQLVAWFTFLLLSVNMSCFAQQPATVKPHAMLLTINQAIGPATTEYIEKGIKTAEETGATVIVLQLNTPGGLDTSMRSIIRAILASPLPVITYVAPSGARAASAGTYIVYASHIAAMAPGTNLGAATPINLLSTKKEKAESTPTTEERKTQNDALAYLRSLAQLRGRSVTWAEQAITQSATLTADEALQQGVINVVAVDPFDLLNKVDNKTVQVAGSMGVLHTKALAVVAYPPDWRSQFLAVITNPNIAYILLLIGVCGILFELVSPGFILPGVVGVIALLLALYAFALLPINYAGLALLLAGIIFLIAEAFFTSGVLAVGGIAAFVMGSIFLLQKGIPGFHIALEMILGVSVAVSLFFLIIIHMAVRARFRPIVSGAEQLLNSVGEIVSMDGDQTLARVNGELWQVKSAQPLQIGQKVIVNSREGLVLSVDPIQNDSK